MSLNDRIKEIRSSSHLTQQAFADKLGLKRSTIASYEIGNIVPSDRTITDICKTFSVSETWLRTGAGEMKAASSRSEQLAAFFGDVLADETSFKHRFLEVLSKLPPSAWEAIADAAEETLRNEKDRD